MKPRGKRAPATDGGAEGRALIRAYLLRILPAKSRPHAAAMLARLQHPDHADSLPIGAAMMAARYSEISATTLHDLAAGRQRVNAWHRGKLCES